MTESLYEQQRILDPYPQCRHCLAGLARQAARFAAGGDAELTARAEAAALRALDEGDGCDLTSPQVANRILQAVKSLTKREDPFREFKQSESGAARRVAARARELVGGDLRSLVFLAALGNNLDFFRSPDQAMEQAETAAKSRVELCIDHVDRLEKALRAQPGLVLYLTDNTGEVFFDLPLHDYLRRRAGRVVLAVKGAPALNDLTRRELKNAGLEDRFDQVADTGYGGVGVDWAGVSQQFKSLVRQADLVISKGGANFETLCTRRLPAPVFFILQIKCEPMRNYLGAEGFGQCALWRAGSPGA